MVNNGGLTDEQIRSLQKTKLIGEEAGRKLEVFNKKVMKERPWILKILKSVRDSHKNRNKIRYKSFREQYMECKEDGTLIDVDVTKYFHSNLTNILFCDRFKKVCSSDVCKDYRAGLKNK